MNSCFESNYIFTGYPGCFWTQQVEWVISSQSPHSLKFLSTRKNISNAEIFFLSIFLSGPQRSSC